MKHAGTSCNIFTRACVPIFGRGDFFAHSRSAHTVRFRTNSVRFWFFSSQYYCRVIFFKNILRFAFTALTSASKHVRGANTFSGGTKYVASCNESSNEPSNDSVRSAAAVSGHRRSNRSSKRHQGGRQHHDEPVESRHLRGQTIATRRLRGVR